ncbi:hypothetical protein HGRIS_002844 [Hohenbuehelia grisea]|uniref:Gag protein n=1 Tax=Hohenbuehelia grisea TaxID=104357 RepID=A0ABR3JMH3_9AGAR
MMVLPPGVRLQNKIPLPDKYGGKSDLEEFDNWIQGLLRWMNIHQMGGPGRDSHQIAILGLDIEGPAATWFNDAVVGVNRRRHDWGFVDVVLGLFDRFIYEATIHEATERFYNLEYKSKEGILVLLHEMNSLSARMVTEPDSYTFKTQLMAKIPRGMALKLIERGISAENSNLRRIVSAARQYEEAQRMVKVYDAQRERVLKKPPKEDTSKQSSRMPGQGHTNDQSHTRTPGQGNRDRPKGFSKPYRDRRPGHRSGGTKPIRSGPPAEYKSSAARPPYQKAPQGRSKTPGQPSGQCYACGSRGHYSNNPICPKYQAKARMQAGYDTERDLSGDEQDARTVSDLGEDHQEGSENDSENVSEPDEGNDGDPNDADGALDEFEGYPDDEVEHNGRMTEQAFGMRIHDSEDEYSDMPALETPPDSDSEGEMIEPVMRDDQGNELLLDRLEDLEVTEPRVSYDDNCSWVLAIAEAVEDYNWFQYREYRGDVENATWERPPYHFVSIPGNLVWDRTAPAMVNVYIDDVTVGNDIANDETESASGSSDDESDDHWDEDPWAGINSLR